MTWPAVGLRRSRPRWSGSTASSSSLGQPASSTLAAARGFTPRAWRATAHRCLGIDFSPASVDYARAQALASGLGEAAPRYLLSDLRKADYGGAQDLAMQIYGEINVFSREDALLILRKARAALAPGGRLLLEAHTQEAVEAMGSAARSWYPSQGGLFSPKPHLILTERHWDPRLGVATIRHDAIDAESAEVSHFAQSLQAYREEEYRELLAQAGFARLSILPGLGDLRTEGFMAIVAER
jgi:hypothetical protein